MERIDWDEARWLNLPAEIAPDGSDLLVTAREGSDFWRTTSYGFVRDSGHALLTDFPPGTGVEVTFTPEFENSTTRPGCSSGSTSRRGSRPGSRCRTAIRSSAPW